MHTYQYGDEIISEGETAPHFFVILNGQIQIFRQGKRIRILGEQDIFGLEHVLFKKPSLYAARAAVKSRVAAYGQETLDLLIRESPRMTQNILNSIIQQLIQTSLNLARGAERVAIEDVDVRYFEDGDVIIEEGSKSKDFFRLVSTQGGLRVSIGGREVGRIEKPGEFFGEMAGVLNLTRQASVVSIGSSVVESYSPDNLDIIIKDHPETALQIMRALLVQQNEAQRESTGNNV